MSSLYEQMISAAADVKHPSAGTTIAEQLEGDVRSHHNSHHAISSASCRLSRQTMDAKTTDKQQQSQDHQIKGNEMSSNSSGATAITILTPEPTESASSAASSPQSVCSTITSEQVTDQLQLVQAEHEAAEKAVMCAECECYFDGVSRQPKILDCIHTFCEPCLIRRQVPYSSDPPSLCIQCPLPHCGQETFVVAVAALQTNIPALTMSIVARAIQHFSSPVMCMCSSNQHVAYLCFSCHLLMCQSCLSANHTSPQHNVESLDSLGLNSVDATCVSRLVDRLRSSRAAMPSHMTVMCPRHPALPVFSYCETCSQPVCESCTPNHYSTKVGDHVTIHLLKGFDAQTYKHECGFFAAYIKHIRDVVQQLRSSLENANKAQSVLSQQHHESNVAVMQQFDQYINKASNLHKVYAEQSDDFLSGVALVGGLERFMAEVNQLREECARLNTLFERARENCSAAEMSSLREWVKRKVHDVRNRCRTINQSVNIKRRHSLPTVDTRFFVDGEMARAFDINTELRQKLGATSISSNPKFHHNQFAHHQQPPQQLPSSGTQPPIGLPGHHRQHPLSRLNSNSSAASNSSRYGTSSPSPSSDCFQSAMQQQAGGHLGWQANTGSMPPAMSAQLYQRLLFNSVLANSQQQSQSSRAHSHSQQGLKHAASFNAYSALANGQNPLSNASFECGKIGSTPNECDDEAKMENAVVESGVVTDSPLLMTPNSVAIPNRMQLRYIAKIGQFGEADGQFTEPSGIATNHQNQLVVADTNSHRIQVFNNHGAFMWRFGECGKRVGQVLYPNRIAIGPDGEYVFTERAPQCLVQVFDSNGQYIRRFGSGDLRHPRGLCIDNEGHVLVLECQVMSVTIYDMRGTRLRRFTFEGIRFPSSICVNDQKEIFIADNIQHYVYVYSYDGVMKRRIGGYPTINFPVGVAINHLGQLVVADNHNNFNITVFTQDGTPISGYESCVKHAQVLDVCLLNSGRAVAISCKDYRVYVYPYQDCSPNPMMDVGTGTAAESA